MAAGHTAVGFAGRPSGLHRIP